MSLIKSISGIRGTIGGKAGDGLNPLDIVKFTAAYATFIRKNTPVKTNKIVVGRDARHLWRDGETYGYRDSYGEWDSMS